MEPVRGGQLASLSEDAESKLRSLRPDEKIPDELTKFSAKMGR